MIPKTTRPRHVSSEPNAPEVNIGGDTADRSWTTPLMVLVAGLLWAALPAPGQASPWTVPEDELTILTTADFSFADEEFLPGGKRQAFPLDGEFVSAQLTSTLRYGFSDRFEGGIVVRPKAVFYRADPVILPKSTDRPNESIADFSSQRYGIGDIDFFGRYKFLDGPLVLTSETRFQLPTGYEPPDGTFEDDKLDVSAIEDDAALGDGMASIQQSVLMGAFVAPTRSFVRLGAGYRLRVGAGDQLRGGLKFGQLIGDSVILFAGAGGAYTLFEGPSIGKTFIAKDPSVPARDFGGSNIRASTLTLDRSFLNVRGGAIVRFGQAEMQIAYARTLVGRNIPVLNTVSVGTSFRIQNLTGKDEDSKD